MPNSVAGMSAASRRLLHSEPHGSVARSASVSGRWPDTQKTAVSGRGEDEPGRDDDDEGEERPPPAVARPAHLVHVRPRLGLGGRERGESGLVGRPPLAVVGSPAGRLEEREGGGLRRDGTA